MKTIKFRGYDTRDGVREMVTFTLDELLAGTDDYELVDLDSVAQFIGYDADGKEIYEGDVCIEKFYCHGEKAKLTSNFTYINGEDDPQHFSYYKLKGK